MMLVMLLDETLIAEAKAVELAETSVKSSVMLLFQEKQLQHARTEEAEAKLEYDLLLDNTDSPARSSKSVRKEYTPCAHGTWRQQVDEAFADYSKIQVFPFPPPLAAGQTHSVSCKNCSKPRPISACECAVRQAFLGSSVRSDVGSREVINFRTERLRWAPAKFESCPDRVRVQAAYVFEIVDAMYNSIPK